MNDMQIPKLPSSLPIIPARNDVFYPNTQFSLQVGRQRSVKALNMALSTEDKYILVVTQQQSTLDQKDPLPDQMYNVGTLCRIKNVVDENQGFRVEFIAYSRFRLDKMEVITHEGEHYLIGHGEGLTDRLTMDKNQLAALVSHLEELVKEHMQIDPLESFEIILDAFYKKLPVENITNLISALFPFTINDKQLLLEQVQIEERLKFLIELISQKVNSRKAQQDIIKKTTEQIGRSQKQAFLREQLKAIKKELGEEDSPVSDELSKKVKDAKLPPEVRKVADEELKRLEMLHPSSSEYNVVRNYLDWLSSMPWSKTTKDVIDIEKAKKILDEDHYGLDKVKKRILEYLAVAKMKNSLKGPILCLAGPPGVGKTSLGRSIARAVGRNFTRISLGGVRDEAEIRGHRRTYVGAMPGKLIQSLKRVGYNNPVFLLDEIDKMGVSNQGDPSAAMLEVLDPEQNNTFTDHYLDVPFDLSNVFFISTANVLEDIPGPLRDRMEIIHISGYTTNEKHHIAKEHLVPKQLKEHGLSTKQVTIKNEALSKIINDYTREAGVRDLQRKIAALCRAAAQEIIEQKLETLEIDENKVRQFLGVENYKFESALEKTEPGVATGMAWTAAGGDILFIEASKMKGSGKLTLTGSLGDVMKESAQIAISYIRTNQEKLKIKEKIDDFDIHIHLPAGSIPKDGPSAGITLLTTLVSLFTENSIPKDLAMTGELSLKGKVLPVGGIKEKVIAAHRAGIKKILIPKGNESNLEEIPQEVKNSLEITLVEESSQVLDLVFSK